jgi:hypothetical protein
MLATGNWEKQAASNYVLVSKTCICQLALRKSAAAGSSDRRKFGRIYRRLCNPMAARRRRRLQPGQIFSVMRSRDPGLILLLSE